MRVPVNAPVSAERQIRNPIGIELMRGVKVGDGAELERLPSVLNLSAGTVDSSDAFRVGSQVDGFGIGVVQVKLDAMRHLVLQRNLQSVVVDGAHALPHVVGRNLPAVERDLPANRDV